MIIVQIVAYVIITSLLLIGLVIIASRLDRRQINIRTLLSLALPAFMILLEVNSWVLSDFVVIYAAVFAGS